MTNYDDNTLEDAITGEKLPGLDVTPTASDLFPTVTDTNERLVLWANRFLELIYD